MRREATHGDAEEEGCAKVKTRHGCNRELEAVVVPDRRASRLAVQHIDKAVFLGKQSWRVTSPEGNDDESNSVVNSNRTANTLKGSRREIRVDVDEKADAETDVGVIDLGKVRHEPCMLGHDVFLEALFDVDAEESLEVDNGDGMGLSTRKDGFVACYHSC